MFVYGTLKRWGSNHRVLQETKAEFVADAQTVNKYPLRIDGLPYLYDEPGVGHNVKGELFALPDWKRIDRLDLLEGHPRFYVRKLIEVTDMAGNVLQAHTYFLNEKNRPNCKLYEEYPVRNRQKEIMEELRRVPSDS